MANVALDFAPLSATSILHWPLTNKNLPHVMQFLATLQEQYSRVKIDKSPTSFTCANCGAQNFVKDKKQYYAVTCKTQGVSLGFCCKAKAVDHFQKGVRSGTVVIHKGRGGQQLE
ncbi:hypothetical protein BDN71DRAFT_1435666 [Pleurotus eryngii]|uniref:Transposase n=1 Tax=Pleurotus eryngii TaxID=5323 RepID=A0A9P5ZL46_PLEER|nr:hypothetical protein BDN71DRAFT_1435666 [Pleurotus eryngii]